MTICRRQLSNRVSTAEPPAAVGWPKKNRKPWSPRMLPRSFLTSMSWNRASMGRSSSLSFL